MKIIFLNTWDGGKLGEVLLDFVREQAKDTDIFCFQEVENDEFVSKIKKILSSYSTTRLTKDYINGWKFDIATFFRKGIKISSTFKNEGVSGTGGLLVNEIEFDNKKMLIANVHGLSMPGDKFDTDERIAQSQEIINVIKRLNTDDNPVVVGGDFNLHNKTKSIEMFTLNNLRDLIKDYKIKRTRNSITWEFHKNSPNGFFGKQKYCDYCFVSKDLKVKKFEVPDIKISDHLPLILEFEV